MAPKTYWSTLNRFLYDKKILAIATLLVDDKIALDFCSKVNLLNYYFASIWISIKNRTTLPPFACKTNVRINFFCVSHHDTLLIIKNLDSNKAHSCGNILIKMRHICDVFIDFPLKLLFETAWKQEKFPSKWKLANVVSAHNKKAIALSAYLLFLEKKLKE